MTAIEIACRQCARQPYVMCINPDGTPASCTHPQRIEDAAAIGERPEGAALVDADITAVVNELF